MFTVRIHSAELPDAFAAAGEGGTSSSAAAGEGGTSSSAAGAPIPTKPISPRPSDPILSTTSATALTGVTSAANPRIHRTRGFLHLYRPARSSRGSSYADDAATPSSSACTGPTLPSRRSRLLLVLAVPSRISPDHYIFACGSFIQHASEIRFLSYYGVEDRYSVLIEFEDQKSADEFYLYHNGWKYLFSKVSEMCHILYIDVVEYTSCTESAVLPPVGSVELPTCPICIKRLGQDISGIGATNCDQSSRCLCLSMWVDSCCPVCQFCENQSEATENHTCVDCGTSENLWICVICGFIGCGRYKDGHSLRHWEGTQHRYSLHRETQRVWDYVFGSYVHGPDHSKSGVKPAYTGDDDCVQCWCKCDPCLVCRPSFLLEERIISNVRTALASRYESILPGLLKSQKEYYEALLSRHKEEMKQRISVATDTIFNDKFQEMQLELQNTISENKKVAEMNEKLVKKQDTLQQTLKSIDERERAQLKLKDEKIRDLVEQIKDFKASIKLRDKVQRSSAADDLKGGTLVTRAMESDSGNGKSSKRKGKRKVTN